MSSSLKKFNLWISMVFLTVNLVLFSFLLEELIDASPPNYGGGFSLLTPLFGLISFLYIRISEGVKPSFVMILQLLNWLFILFPTTVIIISILTFL